MGDFILTFIELLYEFCTVGAQAIIIVTHTSLNFFEATQKRNDLLFIAGLASTRCILFYLHLNLCSL